MNDFDMSNLPKGMSIPVENTQDFFTQPPIMENLRLRDINYAKIILDKINEIEDIEIEVENITVNEVEGLSNLLLNLKIYKKEGKE